MAKGKEHQTKYCAKCGAEIKDRDIGSSYAVVNISQKQVERYVKSVCDQWFNRSIVETVKPKSHNMRPQAMLCMECAEKFVDVINEFVGGE